MNVPRCYESAKNEAFLSVRNHQVPHWLQDPTTPFVTCGKLDSEKLVSVKRSFGKLDLVKCLGTRPAADTFTLCTLNRGTTKPSYQARLLQFGSEEEGADGSRF